MRKLFFILTLSLPLFLGPLCCTFGDIASSETTNGTGILYVLDDFNDAVYIYDGVDDLDGAASADRTLSGGDTEIENPTAIAVDTANNVLYVADTTNQNILAFTGASTKEGDVAPTRRYPGIQHAGAMFYDSVNDRLYVSDTTAQVIKVWDGMSELDDESVASRTITLDYTPAGFTLDRQRDLLYVADAASQAINVYTSASTLATPPTATRTFTNSTQNFVNLDSLTMNIANDILFVSESSNPSVEMFDGASDLSGTEPATRELEGSSTTLTSQMAQVLFLQSNLYTVIDATQISIWEGVNQLEGDTAPDRTITITPAQNIVGIAVDLSN